MVGRAGEEPGSPYGTTRESPSAPPRSESTTSTDEAGVGDEAEAETVAEPTMKVAPPRARAPRSTLRRLSAANSGQHAPSGRADVFESMEVTAAGSRESRTESSAVGGSSTASPRGPW